LWILEGSETVGNGVDDCISRQAAIYIASGYCHPANVAKELAKLPSVQPKRGKWIWNGDTLDWERLHYCSECKKYALRDTDGKYEVLSDFCPHCGADMRTKETDCDYERAVEQLEHDMLYEPTFDPDDGSM
jgi:nitrite reductase/ring-hydroxylating ferredoxin subunit